MKQSMFSRRFVAAWVTLFVLLITILAWVAWKIYHEQETRIIYRLNNESERIAQSVTNQIDHTAFTMAYINRSIIERGADDKAFILKLISSVRLPEHTGSMFSLSLFSWADKNRNITVSNAGGIIDSPKNLGDRDYVTQSIADPMKLKLGLPSLGRMSNQWILPVGMGARNEKGEYIGSITAGLVVDKLYSDIQAKQRFEGIRVEILTHDFSPLREKPDLTQPIAYVTENKPALVPGSKKFIQTPKLWDSESHYTLIHALDDYPLYLLLSYDTTLASNDLLNELIPRMTEGLFLIILLMGLFYYVYRHYVIPVVQLSEAVDQINDADATSLPGNISLPRSGSYEVMNLAEQIGKLGSITTELRIAKKEQDIRNKQLSKAKETIERQNERKTEFMADMSHELRTPLNAIIGMTEVIKLEQLGPLEANKAKYLDYANDVFISGNHLLGLINDMLDLSKIEAGMIELSNDVVDVPQLIRLVTDIMKSEIKKANLEVSTSFQKDLPHLTADQRRLKQVILNLVSNAIKFTPPEGNIHISASTIQEAGGAPQLCIEIEDTGIGMSPENTERALQKFVRVHDERDIKAQGTGLGLPLVKDIMELHRGELHITSTLNVGTSIKLIFPRDRLIT